MITESHKKFFARNKLRFFTGFTMFSVLLAVISFGMQAKTMFTVIGWQISLWVLGLVGIGIVAFCWWLGFYWETHKMWGYEISHTNMTMNPEVVIILNKLDAIEAVCNRLEKEQK